MPSGVMNYLGGRPSISPSIRLFSFLIEKKHIKQEVLINNKRLLIDEALNYSKNDFKLKKYIIALSL